MRDMERVAGELIQSIRGVSGLRQAELARRARMPRSVLNAYERGRRQPGVDALARLASAAGLELRVAPREDAEELARAARVLEQVLDLAELLPSRPRGSLSYPPFRTLVGAKQGP